jgi:hypothetical protein
MARPSLLKCHTPVPLAVRTTRALRGGTEVKVWLTRLAYRPAAVVLLKGQKRLRSRLLLGFARFFGRVHLSRALALSRRSSNNTAEMGSHALRWIPALGENAATAACNCEGIWKPRGHRSGSTCSMPACQRFFRNTQRDNDLLKRRLRHAVSRRHFARALCRRRGWLFGWRCEPGQ